jgi:tetratricopeptide (TPR) repeat protein
MAAPSSLTRPRTRTLIVVGLIVLASLFALRHLARMDPAFFRRTIPATRALAHYLVGDYRGAAHFYRVDLARWAATVPAEHAWSWTMMVRGDLEGAAAQAKAELGQSPEHPAPLLTLAEIALARGELAEAVGWAERVLRTTQDDYDALLLTAVARARQGEPGAAIDALKRALRYDLVGRRSTVFLSVLEVTGELTSGSGPARSNCLLAHLHRYLRIYDGSHAATAARYAERAIAAGDRPDDAYVTLAIVHGKQGYRRRAFEAFQRAVAINPRNTAALLGAARHHADRGQMVEEYRLTHAAFDVAPQDRFVAITFHALLMTKLGDYPRALAIAEAAVTANPEDAEGWLRVAHVKSLLGDHRGGLANLQRAAALTPRAFLPQILIGYSLLQLNRPAEALAAYTRAIALDPSRPEPHYGLGQIYGRERRWADALKEYEIGYALGGRDIADVADLCSLYWETGNSARANACLNEVLTRDPDNQKAQALLEHVRAAARQAKGSR